MYNKDTSGKYYPPGENYKDFSMRMSKEKMADVMYAILMTNARIVSTFHMGWKYTRKRNAHNHADIRIQIGPHMELEFETITGLKLRSIENISGVGGAVPY